MGKNILSCDYDIIILSETWLTSYQSDRELSLYNYNIFRCDRSLLTSNLSRGGGVLIAIKSTLTCIAIDNPDDTIEQTWVLMNTNQKRLVIGCVYIPPSSCDLNYEKFGHSISAVCQKYSDAEIYIFGDYNLPHITWKNTTLGVDIISHALTSTATLNSATLLSNFINFNNLHQYNDICNVNDVLLDLVFSNVNFLKIDSPIDIISKIDNHHPPLSCSVPLNLDKSKTFSPLKFNFEKGNFQDILSYLNTFNWDLMFSNTNLEDDLDIFYNIIYTRFCEFIPTMRSSKNRYPPWFDSNIRNSITDKKIAHKNFKTTNSIVDYLTFSELRSSCKSLIADAHKNFNSRIENNIRHDPKSFWKTVNSYKSDTDIPDNVTLGDVTSNNPTETAELFATFFSSVYNPNSDNVPPYNDHLDNPTILSEINLSYDSVLKSLSELKIDRSAGPDGIPNVYLKECRSALALPLTILFNKSLSSGIFPKHWKVSSVCPVYKKGNKKDVSNYRPICILNSIPKLLEKMITPLIHRAFEHMFIEQQHGFSGSKSTLSNLTIITSYLSNALDRCGQVDVVYTDFAKAFDKVPHKRLIEKLSGFGLRGTMLRWLSDYLTGREQLVRIHDIYSRKYLAPSGVPQGSHLGPLLFLFFINDIAGFLKFCKFLLFADDAKLFLEIVSLEAAANLQEDLNSFVYWCTINGMTLNVEKCNVVRFTTKRKPFNVIYTVHDFPLSLVDVIKDLGVIFTSNGTFKVHIQTIVNKALRVLGFIKRTLHFIAPSTFLLLYVTLVRPIIEYASPIWSPYYKSEINLLESVNRRFMRHLAYLNGTPMSYLNHDYSYIQNTFSIQSLCNRRKINDMLFLHKIINNVINSTELFNLFKFSTQSRTLRSVTIFNCKCNHLRDQHSVINRLQSMGNVIGTKYGWTSMYFNHFRRLLMYKFSN